jgi:murein DD-endopeptidase MepM/ murein hydrolase activator NlpD
MSVGCFYGEEIVTMKIVEPTYSDKKLKSLATAKHNPMTTFKRSTRLRLLSQRSLLLGLGCLASLGFITKDMVLAQAETPQVEISIPEPAEVPPSVAEPTATAEPEYIAPEPQYTPPAPEYIAPEPQYTPPAPEPTYEPPSQPEYMTESPAAAAPEPYLPEPEIAPPTAEPAPSRAEYNTESSENSNNAYIDRTDYNVGATNTYEAPTAVQFSERSTGCDAVLQSGQEVGGALCAPPPQPTAESYPANSYPENQNYATGRETWQRDKIQQSAPSYAQGDVPAPGYASGYNTETAYSGSSAYASNYSSSQETSVASISSIEVGPITISSMSDAGFSYYNQTQRPPALPGNGNVRMMFPLSMPAEITSIFGWRTHPVLGYSRFHTGTDLGAPMGTPVLAAYTGQVAIADWLGGYGLAVVIDHSKQSQETLYGHLSELFVKPGELVQQGEVIGRVGSTGMSTGPHLHFELRQMTNQGWVAIDPGNQLEYALAMIVKTLETGQKVPAMPKVLADRSGEMNDLEISTPKLPPLPLGLDIEIPNLQPPAEFLEKPISKPISQAVSQAVSQPQN